ncbi:unnamed protein product [Fraxinus pennsylvanica]|uniref:Uncharacterized protein n=1 Tax=Fraxinus pennsylvanica TaxID=56036 RepID=A0AAD1ZGI6_9LAMI|nr:unnamed protein product [Fraxinus pennsylvanica]
MEVVAAVEKWRRSQMVEAELCWETDMGHWDGDVAVNKINWVLWDVVCQTKLSRRLLVNGISHVLKGKYFPPPDFLEAARVDAFAMWKSIISDKELLVQELRWRVGNGRGINILFDARWGIERI